METTTKKSKNRLSAKDLLNTGSTLLNLACSGKASGGFIKGLYYFLVGDSTSGKTFLSLTCFAEATLNKNFAEYRLIYDNAEDGALMDIEKFFGKATLERVESPAGTKADPIYSTKIEEFYFHVDDAIKKGQPFIYVLDSMDSLSSEDESEKFEETKDAYRKGKEVAGSYGDGKAKKNSANLRRLIPHLRKTGSILIIINQTRDNLGFGFEKKTRSGGHALRFYAGIEMWSSVKEQISKTVKGKKRQIGVLAEVKIKKNRLTGKSRTIEMPIYHSYGIDDVGSCVQYLLDENHWTKSQQKIKAPEFEFEGTLDALIDLIGEKNYEKDLQGIVQEVWADIEQACEVHRKRRYQ